MKWRSVKQGSDSFFGAPAVPDDEWVSLLDAGRELGYAGTLPVRAVMADSHLHGVRNAAGEPGVTRRALDKEKEWRRTAGPVRRFLRGLRSVVQYF